MQHHRYCSVTSVALNPNEMHCGGGGLSSIIAHEMEYTVVL